MEPNTIFALLGLFAIAFIGNGTVPMPVTFYVLWMGQFHAPLTVIGVGTLGTVLGWMVMAKHFSRWFPHLISDRVHNNIPTMYKKFFLKSPAWAIFIFNAVPFPWDVARVLAIVYKIEPDRVIIPLAFGRIIRYGLLVYIGVALSHIRNALWIALGVLFIPVLVKVIKTIMDFGFNKPADLPPVVPIVQDDGFSG